MAERRKQPLYINGEQRKRNQVQEIHDVEALASGSQGLDVQIQERALKHRNAGVQVVQSGNGDDTAIEQDRQ